MENKKYKLICRVCLVKISPLGIRYLDEPTQRILFECTSVWATPGDRYPQQMCAMCWERCTNWSHFKALAQASDRQLQNEPEELEPDKELIQDEQSLVREEEIVIVKEEPLEYTEGIPIAPEQDEEEDEPANEDPLDCDDRNAQEEPIKMKKGHFECEYCSKTFRFLWKLQRHERTHTNERPFPCDECGKSFKTNQHLKGHKLIHSGIKRFACNQCEKTFTYNGDLIRHTEIHAGVRPIQCDQCDKRFFRKFDLMSHKRSHSSKTPSGCDLCATRFKRKTCLARHLKKQHNL